MMRGVRAKDLTSVSSPIRGGELRIQRHGRVPPSFAGKTSSEIGGERRTRVSPETPQVVVRLNRRVPVRAELSDGGSGFLQTASRGRGQRDRRRFVTGHHGREQRPQHGDRSEDPRTCAGREKGVSLPRGGYNRKQEWRSVWTALFLGCLDASWGSSGPPWANLNQR
jgi:hypothetical protein